MIINLGQVLLVSHLKKSISEKFNSLIVFKIISRAKLFTKFSLVVAQSLKFGAPSETR